MILACFWLVSDIEINTSLQKLKESSFSIEFPKASLRPEHSQPWFGLYWKAANNIKM
tara:strand:+ start:17033 stop:17203 length:171 start_codon:yes stop_codon:yes gene_type:complete